MPYMSALKDEMYQAINEVLKENFDLGKKVLEKVNAYCDDIEKKLDTFKTLGKN